MKKDVPIIDLAAFQELLKHLRTCLVDDCAVCFDIEDMMDALRQEEEPLPELPDTHDPN